MNKYTKFYDLINIIKKRKLKKGSTTSFNKIFGVGRNKTGTTSLTTAIQSLGFSVGDQHQGEMLIRNWAVRDFEKIKNYCKTADFFQDIPFSLPFTFMAMDIYFPGSKFILTIRNSEEWHESMVRFHSLPRIHGEKANSLQALKEASYCYPGYAYDTKVLVYELPGDDPYDKETLISHYEYHNRMVKDYFRHRENDLLILNVGEKDALSKLANFLGVKYNNVDFPWENKSQQ